MVLVEHGHVPTVRAVHVRPGPLLRPLLAPLTPVVVVVVVVVVVLVILVVVVLLLLHRAADHAPPTSPAGRGLTAAVGACPLSGRSGGVAVLVGVAPDAPAPQGERGGASGRLRLWLWLRLLNKRQRGLLRRCLLATLSSWRHRQIGGGPELFGL